MSTDTDTDTSSNMRQFGLYRSIDARTEEFLKLSRKRQIKQGCACAAISTVITVVVVIIIILIYEYSMIPDSQTKTSLSQSWISVMNTTVDAVPFEVKLNKAKLNLNPSTIQILPLILKALKKNIYFENIIEDPISSSPQYEKKEAAEEVYTKNVFSEKRNRMRKPTSRLYTIEYRNSPIIYLRSPTRNLDYFTKIRKIRDYERVMNYVDKMISEKVFLGTTLPMGKNVYTAFKKPNFEYTTPMTKIEKLVKNNQKLISKKQKTKATQTDVQSNCNCPKRMNDILSKFISRLKTILPNLVKEIKGTKLCSHNQNYTTKEIINSLESQKHTSSNMHLDTATNSTVKISHTTYKNNADQSYYYPVTFESKEDFTLNPKSGVFKSTAPAQNTEENEFSYQKTITKQFYQDSESKYNFEESTVSSQAPTAPTKRITTVRDYVTERTTNITKGSQYYSTFTEKYYYDYKDSTPNIFDYLKFLDAHSLELVKKKFISNRQNIDNNKDTTKTNIPSNSSTNHENNLEIYFSTYKTQTTETSEVMTTDTTTRSYYTDISTETSVKTTSLYNQDKEKESVKTKIDKAIKSDDIALEEEFIKESTDYTESSMTRFENEINDLNYSKLNSINATEDGSEYEWEFVKVEEDKYKDESDPKSMIPQSRSSYLEIQRGEWRNDETHDYDNNINNYLLD